MSRVVAFPDVDHEIGWQDEPVVHRFPTPVLIDKFKVKSRDEHWHKFTQL
jgi:hypothetical protein